MAYMFERLQRASRYSTGNRIPEFLRTHPVNKSILPILTIRLANTQSELSH